MKHLKMLAKVAQAEDGTTEFTASTPGVDRAGDVIEPNWDLAGFEKNPVILYAHDYTSTPIGKAVRTWVDGGNLRINVKWVPAEIDPFAEKVRLLYASGFLNAVSVGFKPIEFASDRTAGGGMRVTKSELLEVSAVPVPMNADALIAGKGVRPVFDERKQADRGKVNAEQLAAFLKGPSMETAIEAALRTVTVNDIPAATVKMDPPPASDPAPASDAPAASDPAALCDEIVRLLTPKDGTIAQADFDQALSLLGKLKDELATEPADEPTPEPAPAPKGIKITQPDPIAVELKAIKEQMASLVAISQKDFFEDVENDSLEAALSDPAFLANLGSQLS